MGADVAEKSQCGAWTYALLLFFLGAFGIHRFYLGKVISGVVYVLTGGVFGIGVLLDWLGLILFGVRDGKRRPVTNTKSLRVFMIGLCVIDVIFTVKIISALAGALK